MKADESTDFAGICGSFFRTGLCFSFMGPRNLKMHFKKLGFRLGPDLAILRHRGTSSGPLL
jgi:hypothetical protein